MTATDLASWFDKRTIGALPPQLAADKLRELGEGNIADEIEATVARRRIGCPKFKRKRQLYEHTSHAFGFIRAGAGGSGGTKVVNACSVAADKSLKHARLKVTLDQLRVAKYP